MASFSVIETPAGRIFPPTGHYRQTFPIALFFEPTSDVSAHITRSEAAKLILLFRKTGKAKRRIVKY